MAGYGRSSWGSGSGSGSGYSGGGGYSSRPVKREIDIDEECNKYVYIYKQMKEVLESSGIPLEEVKDFIGGWVSGIKISWDKS